MIQLVMSDLAELMRINFLHDMSGTRVEPGEGSTSNGEAGLKFIDYIYIYIYICKLKVVKVYE